jgi:hypothetical protein
MNTYRAVPIRKTSRSLQQHFLLKRRRSIILKPKQHIEPSQIFAQLAEQYHMGSPIELYPMKSWVIHFYQVVRRMLLGTVICALLFLMGIVALFFYQYLMVFGGHIPDLGDRLLFGLPGITIGLLGCGTCLLASKVIAQKIPTSLLVCTEGLLELSPKQVHVTHWSEIKKPLLEYKKGKRKVYTIYRSPRNPLIFSEAFEDAEGLADLIRQRMVIVKAVEQA